jgi:hypothetical protein
MIPTHTWAVVTTPSSSGYRNTSRTWRRNSGSSSRKSTPWWASDTSPGIGTWPPPISPASEMVWWGARHGRIMTHAVCAAVKAATRWMRVVSIASARVIAGAASTCPPQWRQAGGDYGPEPLGALQPSIGISKMVVTVSAEARLNMMNQPCTSASSS